ncbi:MAG: Uma2 family endonuclease [Silvanigrellales bacterium]|nr:Uma2 family endonuclease [Silvanigrellales bacterium]
MLASTLDAKPFREVLMDDAGAKKYATVDDLVGLADNACVDLINGEIQPRFEPSYEHESAILATASDLLLRFNRTQRPDGTGGWWINANVHVEFGYDVLCPDILGWRRHRVPQRPSGFPVRIRPDWVCEVTVSTLRKDTVDVPRILHAAEVPWYWRIDLPSANVLVFEWTDKGYVLKQSLFREDGKVRIPPFEATQLEIGVLLGDDPSDEEI